MGFQPKREFLLKRQQQNQKIYKAIYFFCIRGAGILDPIPMFGAGLCWVRPNKWLQKYSQAVLKWNISFVTYLYSSGHTRCMMFAGWIITKTVSMELKKFCLLLINFFGKDVIMFLSGFVLKWLGISLCIHLLNSARLLKSCLSLNNTLGSNFLSFTASYNSNLLLDLGDFKMY